MRITHRRARSLLFVLPLLASASSSVATPACPPVASVEGPPAIAKSIATILSQHGILSEPSSCAKQMVRAFVSQRDDSNGYLLRVEDRFGRSNYREVFSAETAASLIESWAVEEDTDLISPHSAVAPAKEDLTANANQPVPEEPTFWLTGSAEIAAASDDSTWYGADARACRRVRALCLGGGARFAHTSAALDPVLGGDLTRMLVGAGGVVSLPLRHGRLAVLPALGFGAAWMYSAATLLTLAASADNLVLQVDGGLVATLELAQGWSLVGEVGATWEPSLTTASRQGRAMLLPLPPSTFLRGGLGVGFSR